LENLPKVIAIEAEEK